MFLKDTYREAGSMNRSALLIRFSWAMAELGFCMEYLTPSTSLGITSATALQLSIRSSWLAWLVLCWPAPWLAALDGCSDGLGGGGAQAVSRLSQRVLAARVAGGGGAELGRLDHVRSGVRQGLGCRQEALLQEREGEEVVKGEKCTGIFSRGQLRC